MSHEHEDFRRACHAGDKHKARTLLQRIEDEEVRALVENVGGPRAMVRFLVQRKHVLHMWKMDSLAGWLREHLREAEPMHLLDVRPALSRARDGGYGEIVRRLETHLQFLQPPDPTRWSRKVGSPARAAFLEACQAGDPERVAAALAADGAVVHAVNKWGQDGLSLLGAYGSDRGHEIVPMLCAAGIVKTALPLITASFWGSVDIVDALLSQSLPLRRGIDEDALWAAAVATRYNDVGAGAFARIAELLIDAGADPNVANRWGTTAWGIGSDKARHVLEELGAAASADGPSRYDAATGCSGVVQALIDEAEVHDPRSRGDHDLNDAAALGDLDRVRFLLDEVYRVDDGLRGHGSPERPMHLAAYFGREQMVQLLIAKGYSPGAVNARRIDGSFVGPKETWDQTVVTVAAGRGHRVTLDILMNSVDFFQGRRARRK